jgi:hypothetical protein
MMNIIVVFAAIYLRNAHVLKFLEIRTFQDKTPKERKKKISDNPPLWAEFQINKLTLELDQIINPGD